jgi:hypothetical protein
MSPESFAYYAARIADLIGTPSQAGLVLDHGAGDGGIGMQLLSAGYRLEFSELAPQFIAHIRAAGYCCYSMDAVPASHFDTIVVNNAIFYVHPSRIVNEIEWLLTRARPGGRLFLLDVPTIQRAYRLRGGLLVFAVRKLTRVYQPHAGGFFVDEARILGEFPATRVRDSWCDYRAHLEIRR